MRTRFGLAWFLAAAAIAPAAAAPPPAPPCDGAASPAPAAIGAPPTVQVWPEGSLGAGWTPPACTGWRTAGFQSLIAVAGRFRLAGGEEALLSRVGAVSTTTGIRYWSVTGKRWQTLIERAHAGVGAARADFAPADFVPGAVLGFSQTDNGSGSVDYRLHVLSRNAERVVLATENSSTVRFALLPLFHPGDLQTLYVFEREGADVWRSYSLTRVGTGASSLAGGHEASGVNRAVAFWRHFAGVPTDAEPPAAP